MPRQQITNGLKLWLECLCVKDKNNWAATEINGPYWHLAIIPGAPEVHRNRKPDKSELCSNIHYLLSIAEKNKQKHIYMQY